LSYEKINGHYYVSTRLALSFVVRLSFDLYDKILIKRGAMEDSRTMGLSK
jgi:hypothetical protein